MKGSQRLVALIAYDDLCLFEFACAQEVLRAPPPEHDGEWYRLTIVSEHGGPVSLPCGGKLDVGVGLDALGPFGTIVVPGWREGPVPAALADALARAHRRGARIVSICTGAFVLAAAGLLSGRRASVHWRWAERLQRERHDVEVDERSLYVDESDVVTSAGAAAGIDMLLHLVRRDFGAAAANMVARGMVVPCHREGNQGQYIDRPVVDPGDERVGKAIAHARANLAGRISVAAMARAAAMSERTFFRHFRQATGTTPNHWLARERVTSARALLEREELSLERLAERVGFGSADLLRHHFRQHVGISPTAYRRTFAARI